MRAVDTNILVRLIARDDPTQVALAESFIAQGVWVPVLALAEAVWVLSTSYQLPPREIGTAVQLLFDHPDLALENREAVAAALDLFRAKPSLGFSDCLLLEIARKAGYLPLGTFDRNLAKMDGAQKL